MTQTKSFQVSFPIEGNRETFTSSGKPAGNFRETTGLKALANKVLQGNRKETSGKLAVSTEGNFKGPVSRVGNSVSGADMDIMRAEYADLSEWLSSRDVIPRDTPAYREVMAQINHLDSLMLRGNVEAFKTQIRHVKYSFFEAEQSRSKETIR